MADTPSTVTLEQAWHYLMTLLAYRNPGKATQANQTRRVLRNLMRHRAVWK